MRRFKRLVMTLLAATLTLNSGGALADDDDCDDGHDLFMGLTTDDPWAASMALGFAKKNLEDDYSVFIFLNVQAVRLAVKADRYPQDTYGLTGQTAQETLLEALEDGAQACVCPQCLTRAGFKRRHLIEHENLALCSKYDVVELLHCSNAQLSY